MACTKYEEKAFQPSHRCAKRKALCRNLPVQRLTGNDRELDSQGFAFQLALASPDDAATKTMM
jgi:hypothetical protein